MIGRMEKTRNGEKKMIWRTHGAKKEDRRNEEDEHRPMDRT